MVVVIITIMPALQTYRDTLCHQEPKANRRRQPKRPRLSATAIKGEESLLPAIGSLARTRRLILAAVRVWELKRRIRD